VKQTSVTLRHTGFPILNNAFTTLVLVWKNNHIEVEITEVDKSVNRLESFEPKAACTATF
jgi:hypothetical protein